MGHDAQSIQDIARHFRSQGYCIIRGAYQGDRLKVLRDKAQAVREQATRDLAPGLRFWTKGGSTSGKKARATITDPRPYTWGVNEITRPEMFDADLISAIADPQVDAVLNALLDRPRAWGLKLLWASQASTYNLGWHRDVDGCYDAIMPFKPAANDHVQFNAALNEDSSFIVVPASHRRVITAAEQTAISADRVCDLPGQIRVDLAPGDIVFMDAHAIHRGQADQGAPRLSLHYSCQAQWVPLKPWGEADHFAWICSDAFINQLVPAARPYYERLRTATRAPTQHDWMVDHARSVGFAGELVDAWSWRRRRA